MCLYSCVIRNVFQFSFTFICHMQVRVNTAMKTVTEQYSAVKRKVKEQNIYKI